MKKILMIIAPENFRDEELLEPKKIFENKGFSVTIASTKNEAKGMLGARVNVDININDVNVGNYDAIIFVGGVGSQIYYNDNRALSIAKESFESKKITAAICIAPVILANAGILHGKKATVWDGRFADMLRSGGAKYTGESVTKDGNVITANGPQAAKQFAEEIIKNL